MVSDPHHFQHGSLLHLLALSVCALASASLAACAPFLRKNPFWNRQARRLLVAGCLVSWLLAALFWVVLGDFRWEQSLPLHFCNLANLIGALAVGRRHRLSQSLIYFWMFALSLWAFLTPALLVGPASAWFWIFWIYHFFIPLSVVWTLAVDRFRPSWNDCRSALGVTLLYSAGLVLLNFLTGWNYGFLGAGTPGQPSLLDILGPYPQRLLWMTGIGSALFFFLQLPWQWKKSPSD